MLNSGSILLRFKFRLASSPHACDTVAKGVAGISVLVQMAVPGRLGALLKNRGDRIA
jgi:hypothetical protein